MPDRQPLQMTRVDFEDALATIAAATPMLPSETVQTVDACGRITANAICAGDDCPRFDCAAMDGFALVSRATEGAHVDRPVRLAVVGESRAGAAARAGTLDAAGVCVISTGAPLPVLFDAVVACERARCEAGAIVLHEIVTEGKNVRRRGEDVRKGEVVVEPGRLLSAETIGALCGFGNRAVDVVRLPRVTILPTGDELSDGGEPPRHAVHDANSPMIAAMIRRLGMDPTCMAAVPDTRGALVAGIERAVANGADLIVSTGGVSVGEHDHVRAALTMLGARIRFHGVAMRPGKPVLFATLPGGALYFGLPGNPVAAAVGARFFVTAAVRRMLGLKAERGKSVSASIAGSAPAGVTRVLKARYDRAAPGGIRIADDQRSHTMRPLIDCDAWLCVTDRPGPDRCRSFDMRPDLAMP